MKTGTVLLGGIKVNKKNLDERMGTYTYKGKKYEIMEDQDGEFYILVSGKAKYLNLWNQ